MTTAKNHRTGSTRNANTSARATAADAPPDPVFVSEVIGDGDDARREVRVGDWTLTAPGAAGTEPEIPDDALASRLGLELRKFRELSGRHEAAGNIAPRKIDAPANKSHGGTYSSRGRGRPGLARFYTEADALFLVTRSETPKAVALTREMIRVYMAARRGLLPRPVATLPPEVVAEVATLRAEVADLRGELATGVVGAEVAEREILAPLRRIASLRGSTPRERKRWRSRVERLLRNRLGHTRRGATWARLDRKLLTVAQNSVGEWLDDAIAHARKNPPGQMTLPTFGARKGQA